MKQHQKGLRCSIYAKIGYNIDGELSVLKNGIKEVTLIGLPEDSQIFEPSEDAPAVFIVPGYVKDCIFAKPTCLVKGEYIPDKRHLMFDGKFIFSSDSRFPSRYPIRLHDRYEAYKKYDMFSK